MAQECAWSIGLLLAGHLLWKKAAHKLTVQGG
jgi:hypothetical protein